MADDFSNLRDFKNPLFQSAGSNVDLKQTVSSKIPKRVCFVITKNSSRIGDPDALEKLIQLNRVYH